MRSIQDSWQENKLEADERWTHVYDETLNFLRGLVIFDVES